MENRRLKINSHPAEKGQPKSDRQDAPPKMISIDYEIIVETPESEQRVDLLHKNIRKYGTVSNTIAAATELNGVIRRTKGEARA